MEQGRDFVTTADAARALGVTVQQVRRLTGSGELSRIARGLVDPASIERYLADRRGGRTRVWSEATAWGAIALLSTVDPVWLGSAQASRLRSTLRQITDPDELIVRARARASVHSFAAHPAAAARLRQAMTSTDPALVGLVENSADPARLDGYLSVARLDDVVRTFGLREQADGEAVVRVTGFDFGVVADLTKNSTALAALDAATSIDPRARETGEHLLAKILQARAW